MPVLITLNLFLLITPPNATIAIDPNPTEVAADVEGLEENISYIAKEGDLSPRLVGTLSTSNRKAQGTLPL